MSQETNNEAGIVFVPSVFSLLLPVGAHGGPRVNMGFTSLDVAQHYVTELCCNKTITGRIPQSKAG